jgi:hypothetical protein
MTLLFPVELDFFFRSWCDLRDGVGTTGDGLVAALALPDTNSLALHGVLSAEGADVTGVLRNFGLLDLLTQRGTVSVERVLGQYRALLIRGRQFSFVVSQSFGQSK